MKFIKLKSTGGDEVILSLSEIVQITSHEKNAFIKIHSTSGPFTISITPGQYLEIEGILMCNGLILSPGKKDG